MNELKISSAEKMRLKKILKLWAPLFKISRYATASLVVGEENLVIGFGPPTLEMLPPSLVATQADVPLAMS